MLLPERFVLITDGKAEYIHTLDITNFILLENHVVNNVCLIPDLIIIGKYILEY